jgi:hypothetical protein
VPRLTALPGAFACVPGKVVVVKTPSKQQPHQTPTPLARTGQARARRCAGHVCLYHAKGGVSTHGEKCRAFSYVAFECAAHLCACQGSAGQVDVVELFSDSKTPTCLVRQGLHAGSLRVHGTPVCPQRVEGWQGLRGDVLSHRWGVWCICEHARAVPGQVGMFDSSFPHMRAGVGNSHTYLVRWGLHAGGLRVGVLRVCRASGGVVSVWCIMHSVYMPWQCQARWVFRCHLCAHKHSALETATRLARCGLHAGDFEGGAAPVCVQVLVEGFWAWMALD